MAKKLIPQGVPFTMTPNAVMERMSERTPQAERITATDFVVWLNLWKRGHKIMPRICVIAADLSLSEPTIFKSLKRLAALKLIERERRYGKSNNYHVRYDASEVMIVDDDEPAPAQKSATPKPPVTADMLTHTFNRVMQSKQTDIIEKIKHAKISDESWRDACIAFAQACGAWVQTFDMSWVGRKGASIEEFMNLWARGNYETRLLDRAAEIAKQKAEKSGDMTKLPFTPAGMKYYLLAALAERNNQTADADNGGRVIKL